MAIVSEYAVCMSFNTKSLCVLLSPAAMNGYQLQAGMSLGHSCYLETWLDMTNMSHSSTLLVPQNSPDEFQLQFERELGINTFAKQYKGIIYIYIYMDSI